MNWKSILGTVAPLALMAIPGVGPALGMGAKAAGILGTAGKIGSAVAPILGAAAGARGKAQETTAAQQIPRDEINQKAQIANNALPGQRLGTAARASYAAAGPTKFAGLPAPGFGARGEAPQFTGGVNAEMDPRVKQLSSSVMDQELQNQMTGGDKVSGATPPPKSSGLDKALSIGSGVSSILGGLGSTGMFDQHANETDTPTPNGVGPSNPLDWAQYLKQRGTQGGGILDQASNLYRPDLLRNVAF